MAETPMPSKEEPEVMNAADTDISSTTEITKHAPRTKEEAVRALRGQRNYKKVSAPEKKPGFFSKFFSKFVNDDIGDVKDYIIDDVLIPSIKKVVSESINSAVDMMLYGERQSPRERGRGSYTSYSAQYRPYRDPRDRSRSIRPGNGRVSNFDISSVAFTTREDAENILADLQELIEDYGEASVADFYSLADMDNEITHVDHKWGWFNLSGAHVIRSHDGYSVQMPRLREIDV